MHQKLVTLCVKNPDPLVKYHYVTPYVVNSVSIDNVNFHLPTILKEVRNAPKKELKKYKRTIQTFLATASTFLLLPLKSMASTLPVTATNLPKTAEGLPPELLALLLKLLVISVGAGVVLAAVLLALTGIGKMFRVKGINTWTTDIIKGLVQVLVAVPVVFVIYYIANLLFAGSGWFISPF